MPFIHHSPGGKQLFIWCLIWYLNTLTWCFQHLCEDAIVVLISQRRVLSLRDVTRRSHSWLVLELGTQTGSLTPLQRGGVSTHPSTFNKHIKSLPWRIGTTISCLKQAHLPQSHIPRHLFFHLACHCCPIYSNHISNVEGCFH